MDYRPIFMVTVWFLFSCLGFYIAWFRGDLFKELLYWNSRIFGWGSSSGKAWLASRYYFWIMRFVATGLFILALVTLILVLINV